MCSSAYYAGTGTSTTGATAVAASATPIEHPEVRVWPTEYSIAEFDIATRMVNLWNWNGARMRWYAIPEEAGMPLDDLLQHMCARTLSHEFIHALLLELEGYGASFNYDFAWAWGLWEYVS